MTSLLLENSRRFLIIKPRELKKEGKMKKNLYIGKNPRSIYHEILILYQLGVKDYEIQYILYLKYKDKLAKKWDN